jgi:hypothetical protein
MSAGSGPSALHRYLPITSWLRRYRAGYIAGVPVIVGLYSIPLAQSP